VDRAPLEQLLGQGLSLADIGTRLGVHEATVSYWMRRHGLDAVNRERCAARGGLARDQLEALVAAGMSIARIAQAVDRSKATVRYWLTRYRLKTHSAAGRRPPPRVSLAGQLDTELELELLVCRWHGETPFCRDGRGYYRCKRCRSEAVVKRRRKMKQTLVEEAGGACRVCGYRRNVRALHFHHLEPSLKRHEINARGSAIALEKLRAEVRKCILLCANCHAEVEAGLITLPATDSATYNVAEPPVPPG
jgi:transposase